MPDYGAKARKIGDALRAELSKTISSVFLLAEDNLTNSTPVDTGHASNNWVLSVRRPWTGVDGSRQSPSMTEKLAGRERVRNFDVGRDRQVYLRNNVNYLQFLDRGSSQQAPAGFVTKAFLAAVHRAPYGRRTAVRKMLRAAARVAYKKGL